MEGGKLNGMEVEGMKSTRMIYIGKFLKVTLLDCNISHVHVGVGI